MITIDSTLNDFMKLDYNTREMEKNVTNPNIENILLLDIGTHDDVY